MPSLHKTLGIPSQEEADELELDLGIRFHDLTHDQRETWKQQTVYLGLYAQTRTFTHAARAAGVSIRKVRSWQAENTLGFNRRLQYAVLEYTEEIHLMLLRHARKPDCPPSLLMMFLRSQMPEKYGPTRRETAPHASHCDHHHDDPTPDTPQHDRESLDDIPQDLHDLKQFAGLTEPPILSRPTPSFPHPHPSFPRKRESILPHPLRRILPRTQHLAPRTLLPPPFALSLSKGRSPTPKLPTPSFPHTRESILPHPPRRVLPRTQHLAPRTLLPPPRPQRRILPPSTVANAANSNANNASTPRPPRRGPNNPTPTAPAPQLTSRTPFTLSLSKGRPYDPFGFIPSPVRGREPAPYSIRGLG